MAEVLAPFAAPLRLVHALTGILLVAGLLGRWVALAQAERTARTDELPAVRALLRAGSVFERIVIPSSAAVFGLGLLTAWSLGYPLLGSLQGGRGNWLPVSIVLVLGIFLLVPTVFIPRGRLFGLALDEAVARDRVTPELVAAFGDPLVRAAHIYELAAAFVVLVLMLSRPF
jgi:Predicted integral membrane protein (DUF2269)